MFLLQTGQLPGGTQFATHPSNQKGNLLFDLCIIITFACVLCRFNCRAGGQENNSIQEPEGLTLATGHTAAPLHPDPHPNNQRP